MTRAVLDLKLPEISIKPEYGQNFQIRYQKYPGLAFTQSGEFVTDRDKVIQEFDSVSYGCYINKMISGEEREKILYNMGERPELREWNSALPAADLIIVPPFFFNGNVSKAFPILHAKNSNLEFVFVFASSWADFMSMRRRTDTDEWEEVPFDPKYVDIPVACPLPDVYATFRKTRDEEASALLELGRPLHFLTFLNNDHAQAIDRGGNVVHSLSCKFPSIYSLVLGLVPVPGNKINFVYPGGRRPIENISIKYGTETRQPAVPSSILELDNHLAIESPVPVDQGFNLVPTTESYSSIDFGSTVMYTDGQALMTIMFSEIPREHQVFLCVRHCVVRRISFVNGRVEIVDTV